ncbi:MAG: phytoene desaturase [Alphaproteobacteria bacterium]|nr:phytoene desaturase [Alphaproteobacteria bacterium]
MAGDRVVIIGTGIGGLSAALDLAARGYEVDVLERAPTVGGKMRQVVVDGAPIDAGPTVMTMRWTFDALCARAGLALDDLVTLTPLDVLARHDWPDRSRLDLFADIDRSVAAIDAFAGRAEAEGFRRFHRDALRMFEVLKTPYLAGDRPDMLQLGARVGWRRCGDLFALHPFATMWERLGRYFRDPRLRQLFGRYATYCGASPFLAPATLMLIAHVEQDGVWSISGGMHALAAALARAATAKGARFHFDADVCAIETSGARAQAARTTDGRRFCADAVIFNGDRAALSAGRFGPSVRSAGGAPAARSLSAVTWLVRGRASGFPLTRHNVFFSSDYAREFRDIAGGRLPADPTVYVCAQDRDDMAAGPAADRLLVLVNAPARGDVSPPSATEIAECARTTFDRLGAAGLELTQATRVCVTPREFETLFPATGGALYGMATHGWSAPFRRPGARTRIPGLYLAGGSVHPGAGVPMACLSGQSAARAVAADLGSMQRSRPAVTRGGMSTPSARTAPTA